MRADNEVMLNGQVLILNKHPTDFTIHRGGSDVEPLAIPGVVSSQRLWGQIERVQSIDQAARDEIMQTVRNNMVAHHLYSIENTDDEIAISDRIIVSRTPGAIAADAVAFLKEKYHLVHVGNVEECDIYRLTDATGINPIKLANRIAEEPSVARVTPEVMIPIVSHSAEHEASVLFSRQWHLHYPNHAPNDILPLSNSRVAEAWELTQGDSQIVIAVIDDGFDLKHPVFASTRIHPAARDYCTQAQDNDPEADAQDFHGTCVASIAVGSVSNGAMVGVAPGCTFLPIRIPIGGLLPQIDLLDVFNYVSKHADIVNCSFGTPPSTIDRFDPAFRKAITKLTESGGRRGLGLAIVFSAGNEDSPTFLEGQKNVNGLSFLKRTSLGSRVSRIPPGVPIYSGHPITPGVISVGAITSLNRKAGYSNWGEHITVVAPSDNGHALANAMNPAIDAATLHAFSARYVGQGLIAAVNRKNAAHIIPALVDNAATISIDEGVYTDVFGGTSGAAPIVSGVLGLMLSVNPALSCKELKQLLMETASTELDSATDLAIDPNLQGVSPAFVGNCSPYFGAGKVDAHAAVARSLEKKEEVVRPQRPSAKPSLPVDGESKRNTAEVMVWITNPDDFPSWPNERKIERYKRVVAWHDYIADLQSKGLVTHVWGSHQLLSRAQFSASQGVLIAVYKVEDWKSFDDALIADPLRDISLYNTTPLKPFFDDREEDIQRFNTDSENMPSTDDALTTILRSAYRSLYRKAPEFVGRHSPTPPANPHTEISTSASSPDSKLQIMLLGINPPEYITQWDDTRKLIHHERVTWWHDYMAMLISQNSITHAWGHHDFCYIGGVSYQRCSAVAVYSVDSYDEFDDLYRIDPLRDSSLFWSVLLKDATQQKEYDRLRLEAALSRSW